MPEIGFDAPPKRDIGAQSQTWNCSADHESDKQQKGIIKVPVQPERTAARNRAPNSEKREDEGDGSGVPLPATQCCPGEWQDGQEAQRTSAHRLLDQRTESNQAHCTCSYK